MRKKQIQEIAFKLISASGEAYDFFYKALQAAKEKEYHKITELISQGDKKLAEAHKIQTEFLVAEARGEEIEYSVVMMHAQDSLMTTILYERIIIEQIELYKKIQNSD